MKYWGWLLLLLAGTAHAQTGTDVNPLPFNLGTWNDWKMISTPSASPRSGYLRFYAKTGGEVCVKNNLGAEACFTVGGLTGSGTANTLPKFTGATTLGNSQITDTGSLVSIPSNTIIKGNYYLKWTDNTGGTDYAYLMGNATNVIWAAVNKPLQIQYGALGALVGASLSTTGDWVFNYDYANADFSIYKHTAGVAASYNAGTDAWYFGGSIEFQNALAHNYGGTGVTTAPDDNLLVGSGTAWAQKALSDCDDASGNHLNYDTTTNAFSCGTSASVGVSGTANTIAKFTGTSAVGNSSITDNGTVVSTALPLVTGSAPAQSGQIRLDNGAAVVARNATGTGDVAMMSLDTTNRVVLNAANFRVATSSITPAGTTFDIGSSTYPFRYIYFSGASGTPGTNNFQLTGTSTGGTRTITAPDANSIIPQAYTCTNQVATALSGATGATTCTTVTSAYTTGTFSPSAHNILSASHGDTTTGSATRGDIITAQGASPTWTRLAKGTQYTVLQMGADEPTWGTITSSNIGSGYTLLKTQTTTLTPSRLKEFNAVNVLTQATDSGASTIYTGTITNCAANACVDGYYTVAGFANPANNGTFKCTASTNTTLTLNNASGVNETHAGTATANSFVVVSAPGASKLIQAVSITFQYKYNTTAYTLGNVDNVFAVDYAGLALGSTNEAYSGAAGLVDQTANTISSNIFYAYPLAEADTANKDLVIGLGGTSPALTLGDGTVYVTVAYHEVTMN